MWPRIEALSPAPAWVHELQPPKPQPVQPPLHWTCRSGRGGALAQEEGGRAAEPPPDDKRMLRFSQCRARPPAPEDGSRRVPAGH